MELTGSDSNKLAVIGQAWNDPPAVEYALCPAVDQEPRFKVGSPPPHLGFHGINLSLSGYIDPTAVACLAWWSFDRLCRKS